MTCYSCRTECRKFGKRQNRQRFQCTQCRKVFTDARDNTLDGMYLPVEKAEMVLRLLLEGNSVSSVERLTEVHHTTIFKLLVIAGEKFERLLGKKIRNVPVKDVQADEIWSFIGKKEKARQPGDDPNLGDAYTFVAIERRNPDIRFLGDAALMTGEMTQTVRLNATGEVKTISAFGTQVWARRGGEWRRRDRSGSARPTRSTRPGRARGWGRACTGPAS